MVIVAAASEAVGASDTPTSMTEPWRVELRRAIRDPLELLKAVDLPVPDALPAALRTFPTLVPLPFLARIRKGDPADPLLRQVLPIAAEDQIVPGYLTDPVGDLASRETPGLLHKYEGRALLVVTGACAVHCRYCFRRHFPYEAERAWPSDWPATLAHLRNSPDITEVLVSGGDPWTLGDDRLEQILDDLESLPQLKRIRFHTRLPILIPERITERLLARLAAASKPVVVVIHANHAAEIDEQVAAALQRLAGVTTVLNQSVLLRGVNDSVSALADLSDRLLQARVVPYYLHTLDRVAGAAHFDVPDDEAIALIEQLRQQLPGYAVPRLVREIAGEPSKTPLA